MQEGYYVHNLSYRLFKSISSTFFLVFEIGFLVTNFLDVLFGVFFIAFFSLTCSTFSDMISAGLEYFSTLNSLFITLELTDFHITILYKEI